MELFLKKSLTSYLNEVLKQNPTEDKLMNFLKKEGYELGKEFPEENGIRSRYLYKKNSLSKYILIVAKKEKLDFHGYRKQKK